MEEGTQVEKYFNGISIFFGLAGGVNAGLLGGIGAYEPNCEVDENNCKRDSHSCGCLLI